MALRLYANDITGYNSDASSLALQPLVNKNLSTLSIWFEQNLLSIYNIKIQTMILGSSTSKYELFIKGMGIEVKPILKILKSNYGRADFDELRTSLRLLLFDMLHSADVDIYWPQWKDLFLTAVAECVRTKTLRNTNSLPWIDRKVRFAIRRKEKS